MPPELLVRVGLLDRVDHLELRVRQVVLALPDRVDQAVQLDCRVHLDLLVPLVRLVPAALRALVAHQAQLVLRELPDPPGLVDHLGRPEPLE